MSFFDKVKEVAKEVGKKAVKEAEKYVKEVKLREERAQLLDLLSKKDLIDLAFSYDVSISKRMTKEDIISRLSREKKLTKTRIRNLIRKKKGIKSISGLEEVIEVVHLPIH